MLRALIVFTVLLIAEVSPGLASDADVCPADRPRRADVAAVRGDVVVIRAGADATPLRLTSAICLDDRIVTGPYGAVELRFVGSDTTISGHSDTIILVPASENVDASILGGLMRFVSSVRGQFSIRTPHQDGGIEGTEALIRVDRIDGDSIILVREGVVRATGRDNGAGIAVTAGQASYAAKGAPPLLATPDNVPEKFRDLLLNADKASDWAIYYPPILVAKAGSSPRTRIAATSLGNGDVDAAVGVLNERLQAEPRDAAARSLLAIAQIFRNDVAEGSASAERAVADDPGLAAPRIAQSYARQAKGDLIGALASAEASTALDPNGAYAWARTAELALTIGDQRKAETSIQRSLSLQDTSLAHAIHGFVGLSRGDIALATSSFGRAITLDSFAPLPRLGLGLAFIQSGDVDAGRLEIETAVALDPSRANLRTWLARAYLAEGRGAKAEAQIDLARAADPDDPTPDLFDGQRLFAANDPIGALRALEAAQEKGGGRRVIRGRPGLGEDNATRGVALARIYDALGQEDAAVAAATAAVEADRTNPGAHRILADVYRTREGAEIARASEYLKYQLLSPPSKDPVQPELAEADLGLLDAAGAARTTFYEYNPLFQTDGIRLDLSGLGGSQDTFASQASLTAKHGNFSVGIGQLYYETEGFRRNNEVRHLIFSGQLKAEIAPGALLFAEYRRRETDSGDRSLEFDLTPNPRDDTLKSDDLKLGLSTRLGGGFHGLGLLRYAEAENKSDIRDPSGFVTFTSKEDVIDVQGQVLYQSDRFDALAGFGFYDAEEDLFIGAGNRLLRSRSENQHSIYGYGFWSPNDWLSITVGLSLDHFDLDVGDRTRLNPKLGARISVSDATELRAAYTRTLQRRQIVEEQLEPTTVAGFSQVSEDSRSTLSGQLIERFGFGLDHRFNKQLSVGAEAIWTNSNIPVFGGSQSRDQFLARAYGDLILSDRLSLSLAVEHESSDGDTQFFLQDAKNTRVPLRLSYFDRNGFFANLQGTLVHHRFRDPFSAGVERGDDLSLVVDAGLGYRLPGERGVVSLQVQNLFGSNVRIQEPRGAAEAGLANQAPPEIARSRSILLTFSARF